MLSKIFTMKPGILISFGLVFIVSCTNNSSTSSETGADSTVDKPSQPQKWKEENVTYNANGVTMKGYLVYDSTKPGKRPGILVVHEWWGLNDYPKMRARKLAQLGYVAMAVDMYGDGKIANNPDEAGKMAGPFYKNLELTKSRFDAALNKLKTVDEVDTSQIGAIGYCFGGGVVLNVARMGEPLVGVVSFHGTLLGAPARKDLLKSKILVCHGQADQAVKLEDLEAFKKQMDSIGANYTVKVYPNATHAFTNPMTTEIGEKYNLPMRYNAAADSASWADMKDFFGRIFK